MVLAALFQLGLRAVGTRAAITGILPFTVSSTQRTTASSSSWDIVLDSPVVPSATMPSVPLSRCHCVSSFSFPKSMLPSALNGVTSAT